MENIANAFRIVEIVSISHVLVHFPMKISKIMAVSLKNIETKQLLPESVLVGLELSEDETHVSGLTSFSIDENNTLENLFCELDINPNAFPCLFLIQKIDLFECVIQVVKTDSYKKMFSRKLTIADEIKLKKLTSCQ